MNELVRMTEEIQNKFMEYFETKKAIIVFFDNNNVKSTIEMHPIEEADVLDEEIYITDGINSFTIIKASIIHIEKIEEVVSLDYEIELDNGDLITISFII